MNLIKQLSFILLHFIFISLDYHLLIGKVFALPTEEVNPITLNSGTNNTDIIQFSDDSSLPIPSSEIPVDTSNFI